MKRLLRAFAALLLPLLLAPSMARASSADDLWDRYIGTPHVLPYKVEDLRTWLEPQDGKDDPCDKQIKTVLSGLSKYAGQAYGDKSKKAEHTAARIHDYLVTLVGNSCYESAAEAYLLGSVYEADRYDAIGESAIPTTGCNTHCEGPPQSLYLLLLTKALIKAGAIKFVTPSACSIEFAYLCDPGSIQLNPISKPIEQGGIYGSAPEDFAGHYFHELSHLFRDKFVSETYVTSHFHDPSDPAGIDWKSYLLVDETLAKIFAASIEISNGTPDSWDSKAPNVIGNDLTLYLQNGPLQQLLEHNSSGGLDDIVSTYSQFVGLTFLMQPFDWEHGGTTFGSRISDEDLERVREIYVTLQNSYFPGVDPQGKSINLADASSPLNPRNQSLDFDPLNLLLSYRGWGFNPYVSAKANKFPEDQVWPLKQQLGVSLGPLSFGTGISLKVNTVIPIVMYLSEIGQVVDSLQTATPVCRAFNQELTQAALAPNPSPSGSPMGEYLGGSCLKDGTSSQAYQPENGGRTHPAPPGLSALTNNADPKNLQLPGQGAQGPGFQNGAGWKPVQPGVFQNQNSNPLMTVEPVPGNAPSAPNSAPNAQTENGGRPDSPARP